MDLCQERELYRCHVCSKNVDGKIQERSKKATLCICGPRESLRQGSERRAVVLHKKIRNGGKVCARCTGYVRGKRNSGEVCSSNHRNFQGQDRTAPGISVKSVLFAVIMDRLTDEVTREPPVERRLECWR